MHWTDHIIPAQHAGTRPVLRRTRQAVEDVLAALAKIDDDVGDRVGITREEMRACFEYASTLVADRMMQRADPGGAKIHVSHEQLKSAFKRHRDAGRDGAELSDSCLLLLIYAIECGLKRLLLDRRGKKTTLKLDKDDLTHHLDDLLRLLGQPPRFHAVRLVEPDEDVGPDRIHEALRYGRRLSKESRQKLLAEAGKVMTYIEENFRWSPYTHGETWSVSCEASRLRPGSTSRRISRRSTSHARRGTARRLRSGSWMCSGPGSPEMG